MSENNRVYEVAQMMRDQSAMRNDMTEAMALVQNMFRDKYISKLQDAVQLHRVGVQSSPPREVQLMSALKAFVPEQNQKSIDNLIDAITMMNTVQNIRDELHSNGMQLGSPPPQYPYPDNSTHHDGVYDMDHACLSAKQAMPGWRSTSNNMTGVFLLMAMMGIL